jgi:ABC-2 type transport system permease protein
MNEILVLVKKNLKLIFDSPKALMQLLVPVLVILVFMKLYTVSQGVLRVGIIDNDNSKVSSQVIENVKNMTQVDIVTIKDEKDIKEKLTQNDIILAISIPKGFEADIMAGNITGAEIYSSKSNSFTDSLKGILDFQTKNISDLGKVSSGDKDKFYKLLEEYKNGAVKIEKTPLKDKGDGLAVTESSIGFMIYYMMLRSIMISGLTLQEKKENTYSRIFVAPVSSIKYTFASILSNVIFLALQVVVILVSLKYVFKIETGVDLVPMFLLLIMISIVTVAFGMLCIALFKESQSFSTFTGLIVTATAMFSGCFVPAKLLPDTVQKVSFFTPQRWVIDGIQKLQNGNSLSDIRINFVVLLLFTVAFLLIAAYRMRHSQKAMSSVG